MEKIWFKSWPGSIPRALEYKYGKVPLHQYLREHASKNPHKVAYHFYGGSVTYAELHELSNRLANLLSSMGVKKGDRVAVFLQNCPQFIIAYFGAQKVGAVFCPCSPMYKELELEYQLADLEAKVLITSVQLYSTIVENIRGKISLEQVITTDYGDFIPEDTIFNIPEELQPDKTRYRGAVDLMEELSKQSPAAAVVKVNLEDTALIVYTSGTTGLPKGAMLSYESALFKGAANYNLLPFPDEVKEKDVWIGMIPLFHIAGMLIHICMPVYGGYTTVLFTRFDPESTIKAIEMYTCTAIYSSTRINLGILNFPGVEHRDLSSLRFNISSHFGIPMTEANARRWENTFKGCRVFLGGYGLTETHTGDTSIHADKIKWDSCGMPVYEQEIKITDPDFPERELALGEGGEIAIRNPAVFKGYWKKPDETAKVLRDGFVYTGDIGKFDREGYLHIIGRKKEIIKQRGFSVFPEDVERLLINHPAAEEVVVTGVPDASYGGEKVKAIIVLAKGYEGLVTEEEIIEWCKQNMSAYKYPREVEFRKELPRSTTGKLLRKALRAGESKK